MTTLTICRPVAAALIFLGCALAGPTTAELENIILETNEMMRSGMFPQAEVKLAALRDLMEQQQRRSVTLGTVYSNLGYLYFETGRPDQAKQYSVKAMRLYEELDEPVALATTLGNLGSIYQDLGDYMEAENCYRRSITIWEQLLSGEPVPGPVKSPAASPTVLPNRAALCSGDGKTSHLAAAINNLASLYVSRRQFTKAERQFRRALDIQTDTCGADNLAVTKILTNLGVLYQNRKDYRSAEITFQKALEGLTTDDRDSRNQRANILHSLALLQFDLGEPVQGEPLMEEALGIWKQDWGSDHPTYARGLANLGAMRFRAGRYGSAEALFLEALRTLERVYGPGHYTVGEVVANYAVVLEKLHRKRDAKRAEKRANAILARHSDENLLDATVHITDLTAFR